MKPVKPVKIVVRHPRKPTPAQQKARDAFLNKAKRNGYVPDHDRMRRISNTWKAPQKLRLRVEFGLESDGRVVAIARLESMNRSPKEPFGVHAYGSSRRRAGLRVVKMALQAIVEQIVRGDRPSISNLEIVGLEKIGRFNQHKSER